MAENKELIDNELLGFLEELTNDNVTENFSGNDQAILIPSTSIEKFNGKISRCIETKFVLDSIAIKEVESKQKEASGSKDLPNVYLGMQTLVLEVKLRQVLEGDTERRILTKSLFLPEPYDWKDKKLAPITVADIARTYSKVDWLNNLYHELTRKDPQTEGKKLDFSFEFTKEGKPSEELLEYFKVYGKPAFTADNKDVIQFKFKWEVYFRKILQLFQALSPEEKGAVIYAKVTGGTTDYPSDRYIIPDERFDYSTGGKPSVFERAFETAKGVYKACTLTLSPGQTLLLTEKKKDKPAGSMPTPPTTNFAQKEAPKW